MSRIFFSLLIMICVPCGYSQDMRLFNAVSSVSYKVRQMWNPATGKVIETDNPDTAITITVKRPDKLQFSSIDEIWSYLTMPLPSFSAPKNICFVIDISGSMKEVLNNRSSASRMSWLIDKCELLFEEIGVEDFISVVTFSGPGSASPLIPPRQIRNAAERQECIEKIKNLVPEGSTHIAQALDLGYRLVEQHYRKGYINRLLLLTDGETFDSKEDSRTKVQDQYDRGISTVSTIALSTAADKEFMNEIAGLGGGLSIFVDDSESDFRDKFKTLIYSNRQEIQEELNTLAAWDLEVGLRLQNGVTLIKANPAGSIVSQAGDNQILYTYQDLSLSYMNYASEFVTIVMYVSLNSEVLTKQRDKILIFSVSNRDRKKRFPPYQKDYPVSLNLPIQEDKGMFIFLEHTF